MTREELETKSQEELDELVHDLKSGEAAAINNERTDGPNQEEEDELTHEAKAAEAAGINNQGREAQIEYILGG
jgi:hypothetical protein